MSVFQDQLRTDLEEFCRKSRVPTGGEPSPFNYFIEPDPDHLLRVAVGLGFRRARLQYVYSILRGKDLETGDFSDDRRDQQFEILKDAQREALDLGNWHEFMKTLIHAGYRSRHSISSKNALLFSYIYYLIGRKHLASTDTPSEQPLRAGSSSSLLQGVIPTLPKREWSRISPISAASRMGSRFSTSSKRRSAQRSPRTTGESLCQASSPLLRPAAPGSLPTTLR